MKILQKFFVDSKHLDLVQQLEKAQYETDAHKEIISWMMNNNNGIQNDTFKMYHNEYIQLFKRYQQLKNKFEEEVVRPTVGNDDLLFTWNLDFTNKEVTISQ